MRIMRLRSLILIGVCACSGSGSGPTSPKAAPKISGYVSTWDMSGYAALSAFNFTVGDTILVAFRATSNYALTWMGLQVGSGKSGRDSVWVQWQDTASVGAWLPVLQNASGHLPITIFAHDTAGGYAEATPIYDSAVFIYPTIAASATKLSLASGATPAIDNAHDRLLQSDYSGGQVVVYSLVDHTQLPSIPVPGIQSDVAVSPSGDSIAVRAHDSLVVLDLTTPTPTRHAYNVVDAVLGPIIPSSLVWLSGGRLFAEAACASCVDAYSFFVVDASSGVAHSVGNGGDAFRSPYGFFFQASSDESKILIMRDLGVQNGQRFDAVTDSFSPYLQPSSGLNIGNPTWSVSADGSTMLVGPYLANSAFTDAAYYAPPRSYGMSTLSASGHSAWFSTSPGVLLVRLSDGAALGQLTYSAQGLGVGRPWLTRDGAHLAVFHADGLYMLDVAPAPVVAADMIDALPKPTFCVGEACRRWPPRK